MSASATPSTPHFQNLTILAQKHLGIQQAQSITAETIASDALARLHGKRGDVQQLIDLWSHPSAWLGGAGAQTPGVPERVQSLVEGLAIARTRQGKPHTFLPYVPELVTNRDVNKTFRDMGVTVVDALWGGSESPLASSIKEVTNGWKRHPLAQLFSHLCKPYPIPSTRNTAESRQYLLSLLNGELEDAGNLRRWARQTIAEDWSAWVEASKSMSIDEQLQSLTVLIGFHLHVALQWRLAPDGARPVSFCLTADARSGALVTASCNVYQWWQGQALTVFQQLALDEVVRVATEDPALGGYLESGDPAQLSYWSQIRVQSRTESSTQSLSVRYQQRLQQRINEAIQLRLNPTPETARMWLRDALLAPYSNMISKVKDYLRQTGRAAAFVGPDTAHRKRYQVDERLLGLLARLHTARPESSIQTNEEDPHSIEAFFDDIFQRYGILFSRGRESAEEVLAQFPLVRFLPTQAATEPNRHEVERCLEGLRLLRRYSDASAVIVKQR